MQVNDEIKEIVEIIKRTVPVVAIYLFGSFANGTATEKSDYDFYVVIKDNTMRDLEAGWEIRYNLPKQTRPIDILVGTQSRFDDYKDCYSVEEEVYNKGVKLYG